MGQRGGKNVCVAHARAPGGRGDRSVGRGEVRSSGAESGGASVSQSRGTAVRGESRERRALRWRRRPHPTRRGTENSGGLRVATHSRALRLRLLLAPVARPKGCGRRGPRCRRGGCLGAAARAASRGGGLLPRLSLGPPQARKACARRSSSSLNRCTSAEGSGEGRAGARRGAKVSGGQLDGRLPGWPPTRRRLLRATGVRPPPPPPHMQAPVSHLVSQARMPPHGPNPALLLGCRRCQHQQAHHHT